jgi:hypothetical protein
MNYRSGKFLWHLSLVLLVLATSAVSTSAQRLTTGQFERGEELLYDAEFSRALLRSVDVAEFRFSATRIPSFAQNDEAKKSSDNRYALQFTGEIKSKGFFTKLFNLNFLERVTSIVEPESFNIQNTKRFDQQGKRVRASETVYDLRKGKLTWTESDPKDPSRQPRVASASFTGQIQDVLSAIYFLRTRPLDTGSSFQLSVTDSGRIFHVPISVLEKKKMKTVMGKVDTVCLEAKVFGADGLINSEGQFLIWLTGDSRHVPVRARVKSEYGIFEIKLKKIS